MSRSRHYERRKGPLDFEFYRAWKYRRDDERTGLRRVRIYSDKSYRRARMLDDDTWWARMQHRVRMLSQKRDTGFEFGTTPPL